jgi:hydroxyacylglutathione hydrolase
MRLSENLALVASFQFRLAGRFDCHVYALRGPEGVVLIDAGGGREQDRLFAHLDAAFPGTPVTDLVLTHTHPDHALGAAGVRRRTGCRVWAPALTRAIVETGDEAACGIAGAKEAGMYPADLMFEPCPVDADYRDGAAFTAGGLAFEPILVRGHSPDAHSFAVTLDGRRSLFAGDVVFYGGVIGLINAPGSDMAGYRADLCKLSGRGIDALFPGHGLFTFEGGQRHIDCAVDLVRKGFIPRTVGQWDTIF